MFYSQSQFIIGKGAKLRSAKGRDTKGRGQEGYKHETSIVLCAEAEITLLVSLCDITREILPTRKLTSVLVFRVFIEVPLHTYEWLIAHVVDFNLQISRDLMSSIPMVGVSGMASLFKAIKYSRLTLKIWCILLLSWIRTLLSEMTWLIFKKPKGKN